MRLAQLVTAHFDAPLRLDLDLLIPFRGQAIASAVTIGQQMLRIIEMLDVEISDIDAAVCVAPTERVVKTGVNVRLAENGEAPHIPSFSAVQVRFVALPTAEKRVVRIDKQHGVSACAFRRTDRPHIGSVERLCSSGGNSGAQILAL